MPKEPLIEFVEVKKSFGNNEVLRGVNLTVYQGQTLAVIGSSGCGKSVLMSLLVGLIPVDSGRITIKGQEVTQFTSVEQWNAVRFKIGFLFQDSALYDSMNAGENIAFPLRYHTELSEDEIKQKVREKLKMVNLEGVEEKMPGEISGGMQKRVALARAIILDPEIIIYDEPTTGLDPVTAEAISELILILKQRLSVTSLVVTHDMACVYKVADQVAMLYGGKIIAEGTPQQIRESKDLRVMRFVSL
ncbi:MAG TPA: ABC transporter ATP-binding protein [Candidatus Omnitrophica bacterium]|nr:ABC transporter ATP-binding protein [Candidatus Omnitrophota bacterium]